jgi:radical SAM superfamily enzyme YgiQ (UPF0313 family)
MSEQLHPAVILVADRTLSADYRILLEGMLGTMQTTRTPGLLMRTLLSRRIGLDGDGRACRAPLGIRRMEAALVKSGAAAAADVVCTTPEGLKALLGPWVKIVAVSSGDPLGMGMSNSTTEALFGGKLYSRLWTARMMAQLRRAKEKHGFRVLVGGPGAWQWRRDRDEAQRLGVDGVFEGYFEAQGPDLFRRILAGEACPPHTRETGTAVADLRPILGPSALGAVEISRGCGRGCRFCLSAEAAMTHVPIPTILADLETNARAGARAAVLGSEDFFRYGSAGPTVRFEKLIELLQAAGKVEGILLLQIDHANVSSLAQLSVEQLREVRTLLVGRRAVKMPWLNIGVESASGELVQANAPGKIAPFRAEDWEDLVRSAAGKVAEAGFFPVFSFVLGLPGETPENLQRTVALVRDLAARPASIFPIFHEPLPGRGAEDRFGVSAMLPEHLEILRLGYEANFQWVPALFTDNQRAAGVGWTRRTVFQLLGLCQVPLWRRRFRFFEKQIARRGGPKSTAPRRNGPQSPPEASGGRMAETPSREVNA